MRLTLVAFLLLSLTFTCLAQTTDKACVLRADLFARRMELASKLDSEIAASRSGGNKNRGVEDAQAQLQSIDKEYYQFMLAASNRATTENSAERNACCTSNTNDPIAVLICKLSRYMAKQNTAEEFVDGFPSSRDLGAFWALDQIANVTQTPGSVPSLFSPDGPVSLYITELFKLVTKGDKKALQKYLELYLHADGEYAELMEDELEQLFSKHPEVVLENWNAIKSNKRVMPNLQDSLSSDQKREMKALFRRHCQLNGTACTEVIGALR